MNAILRFALRVAVSVAALAYVISHARLHDIWQVLANTAVIYVLIAMVIDQLTNFISSKAWHSLASSLGLKATFTRLLHLFYVGKFFNVFLPTTIGGDVVRALHLTKDSKKGAKAVASIMMSRLVGLAAMVTIFVIGIMLRPDIVESRVLLAVAVVLLAFTLFTLILFSKVIIHLFEPLLRRLTYLKLNHRILKLHEAIRAYRHHHGALAKAYVFMGLFHLLSIVCYYLLAVALGLEISFTYFLIIVPLVNILTALPISLNGVGHREGGFFYFLTQGGVPPSAAIALPLLSYIFTLDSAIIGAIAYTAKRK